MIGFEAELAVPTFRDSHGMVGRNVIYSFLLGGYPDTGEAVGGNDLYRIKPDVSDYASKGRLLLLAMKKAFNEVKASADDVRMTKMEYETPPLDEARDGSDDVFAAQAAAIREHADKFAGRAADQIVEVPDPAVHMFAGVPLAAFDAVLADLRLVNHAEIQKVITALGQALARVRAATKYEFAMQATAGILPSAIPTLFESELKPLDQPVGNLGEAWRRGYPLLRDFVDETMTAASVRDAVPTGMDRSFRGHLYLIASYLLGDALTQTAIFSAISAKNAVPYHAKLNLGDFRQAAPHLPRLPDTVVDSIAVNLTGKEWTRSSYWVNLLGVKEQASKERLVYDVPAVFVSSALTGAKVRTFINQSGKSVGRERDVPDPAPNNPRDELGFQLEFRRLGDAVGPDGLWPSFEQVIRQVRTTNLPHLGEESQQRLQKLLG